MANTRKARNQGQNQPRAEAPVDSEIKRAAERIGYEANPLADVRQVAGELRGLLSCGVYVNDQDDGGTGCGFEVAIRIAALAQLKAIAVALANEGNDHNERHHQIELRFDAVDASEALAGTIALLENSPKLVDYLRAASLNTEAEVAS